MAAAVQVDEAGQPILYYPEAPYPSRRAWNTRRTGDAGVVHTLRSGAAAAGDALRVATDRALAHLPPDVEAAVRHRAQQAEPFLPHAACALVGLLLGRIMGRRAERKRWTRGSGPAPGRKAGGKRASEPELEARLHSADRDARRADAELASLHAEMKALERQLERSKACGPGDEDDAEAGAALRTKLTEAAAAYDTLARVLAAERATGALRLARAVAENELLQEQLAQARGSRRHAPPKSRVNGRILRISRALRTHCMRDRAAAPTGGGGGPPAGRRR
jgi:hypothetical protein